MTIAPEVAAPILDVRNLRVEFRLADADLHAVRGVTFHLGAAETLGIVGESGSGKSVTALSMLRLLPEPPARVEGTVLFEGRNLLDLHEKDLRGVRGRRIAMIFQDPTASLNPVRTVGAQIEETISVHLGLTRTAARKRAVDFLGLVGIPAPERKLGAYPHQFSGGMCQRVMIASALSCEPQVILADEPTTALDVSVQAQILELLRNLTGELRTSVIIISHDLSVVAGIADRVAVMYAGEIVESGPTDELFALPRHPYTRALLECVPRLDKEREEMLRSIPGTPPDLRVPPPGCSFAARCAYVVERCRRDPPILEEKAPRQLAACWVDPATARRIGNRARSVELDHLERETLRDINGNEFSDSDVQPELGTRRVSAAESDSRIRAVPSGSEGLVVVRDLTVHYASGARHPLRPRATIVRAVDRVSFEVRPGETLGLVGESGSGKSTTARAILQLEPSARGVVVFEGRELGKLRSREMRRVRPRMQLIFQNPYGSLNPRLSVARAVGEPFLVHRTAPRHELRKRVDELLVEVGLEPRFASRYPSELSGGQRQRVVIARSLALNPSLVIADEPTSALDVSVRAQILNLMQELQAEKGLTYIFISHDLSVVRHMSDRVAVMYLGKIVELADRDTLYRDPQHPYTQALLSVVPIADPKIEKKRRHTPIAGEIPSPDDPPPGCHFHTRCPVAFDRCRIEEPPFAELSDSHYVACWLARRSAAAPVSGTARERETP